jgi:hypothetical protein
VRSVLLWGGLLLLVTAWVLVPLLSSGDPEEQAGPSGVRVDPSGVYNPVLAGEPLPDGFRQVLPRDAIRPVYEPEFVSADDVSWDGEADVIGVEIEGEARAYPVSFLNGREMVIDEIADVPIVVTW